MLYSVSMFRFFGVLCWPCVSVVLALCCVGVVLACVVLAPCCVGFVLARVVLARVLCLCCVGPCCVGSVLARCCVCLIGVVLHSLSGVLFID